MFFILSYNLPISISFSTLACNPLTFSKIFISRSTVLLGIFNIFDISAIVTALLDAITKIILSANPPFNPPFWRFGVLGSDMAALSKAESSPSGHHPSKYTQALALPVLHMLHKFFESHVPTPQYIRPDKTYPPSAAFSVNVAMKMFSGFTMHSTMR